MRNFRFENYAVSSILLVETTLVRLKVFILKLLQSLSFFHVEIFLLFSQLPFEILFLKHKTTVLVVLIYQKLQLRKLQSVIFNVQKVSKISK